MKKKIIQISNHILSHQQKYLIQQLTILKVLQIEYICD